MAGATFGGRARVARAGRGAAGAAALRPAAALAEAFSCGVARGAAGFGFAAGALRVAAGRVAGERFAPAAVFGFAADAFCLAATIFALVAAGFGFGVAAFGFGVAAFGFGVAAFGFGVAAFGRAAAGFLAVAAGFAVTGFALAGAGVVALRRVGASSDALGVRAMAASSLMLVRLT